MLVFLEGVAGAESAARGAMEWGWGRGPLSAPPLALPLLAAAARGMCLGAAAPQADCGPEPRVLSLTTVGVG